MAGEAQAKKYSFLSKEFNWSRLQRSRRKAGQEVKDGSSQWEQGIIQGGGV